MLIPTPYLKSTRRTRRAIGAVVGYAAFPLNLLIAGNTFAALMATIVFTSMAAILLIVLCFEASDADVALVAATDG